VTHEERSGEKASAGGADTNPPEPFFISEEDSASGSRDPVARKAEFRKMVRETGAIECPCGWAGDATAAQVTVTSDSTDIDCPGCRRRLRTLLIEDA